MLFEEKLLEKIKRWNLAEKDETGFGVSNGGTTDWDDFLRMVECFYARQRRHVDIYYTNGEIPNNTRLIKLDRLKKEVEDSIKRQKSIYKDNDGNR
jgi:hypothetical protein